MRFDFSSRAFVILWISTFLSCTSQLQCEKHYIPYNFIGKVTIYFEEKSGQKIIDGDGCIVYQISDIGTCYSGFSFKEGIAYPHKTFSYFEIRGADSSKIIREFYLEEYLQNVRLNNERKYVYFLSSGYENLTGDKPYYTYKYAVDFGKNYKKYVPSQGP